MNKPQPLLSGVQHIPVGNLLLDGDNPRLPGKLRGGSQSELLNFLRGKGVLEELAQSCLDNGFFQLEFRDSLTEMDSRFRGNDGQTATASVKATCLAEMTSFPRKRESIA